MLHALASRPGGIVRALLWIVMYASARIVFVRTFARKLAGRPEQPDSLRPRSVFEGSVPAILASLRSDGFDSSLRLKPEALRELLALGNTADASTPYSPAVYPNLSMIERVAGDPVLNSLAGIYLGGSPIYQGCRIWWTRPGHVGDPRQTGATFHYDLYDYRALIFLFYLTDVDRDCGPHICVRGSHRSRTWRDQSHPRRHRSDEEIIRSYGRDRITTICGPAGQVIVEDPFCFHKVKLPVERERLALQLLFTGGGFPAPSFQRDRSVPARLTSITM